MSSTTAPDDSLDRDEVSGEHRLSQGFTFRSAFALAFADISPDRRALRDLHAGPVLGRTGLLLGLPGRAGGPAPGGGRLRRVGLPVPVQGTQWGWFAAWAYIWGLTIALSTLSYDAAGFLLEILGVKSPSGLLTTSVALLKIAAGTLTNMVGRGFLKVMVLASITAEVLGRARFRAHPGTSRGVC